MITAEAIIIKAGISANIVIISPLITTIAKNVPAARVILNIVLVIIIAIVELLGANIILSTISSLPVLIVTGISSIVTIGYLLVNRIMIIAPLIIIAEIVKAPSLNTMLRVMELMATPLSDGTVNSEIAPLIRELNKCTKLSRLFELPGWAKLPDWTELPG